MAEVRHVGFRDVVWASLNLDKLVSLNWTTVGGGGWSVLDDDSITRQDFLPFALGGQITLTGRRAAQVQPTYFGIKSDIEAKLVGSDPDGLLEDPITFKEARLVSIANAVTTNGLLLKTLTFQYNRYDGSKALWSI